jgi:hypothetical protein
MRIRLWLAAALLLSAVTSWARPGEGYYIEEKVVRPAMMGDPERVEVVRTWVLGDDRMRQDAGAGKETVLIRVAEKRVVVLDHDARTFLEIALDDYAPIAALGLAPYTRHDEQGREIVPTPLFRRTGRTKSIGKWRCFEVEVQGDPLIGARPNQWVATNTGFDPRLYARVLTIPLGGKVPETMRAVVDQMVALGGYPVQTVVPRGPGKDAAIKTRTVKVLQKREIDAKVFEIPGGYAKVDLPAPPTP